MANMKDIARAAKVSIATVSNVVNGKPNVSDEMREKILKLCKQMNYYPNIHARNLKTGKTGAAMFVFSDFQRNFYLRVINGINDCLLENGISMIVCTQTGIDNYMRNNFVDGAIVLDKSIKDRQILSAAENMPVVVMDRILDSPHISSVITDNRHSMGELVDFLLDSGYRDFCYVGGVQHTLDHKERYEQFCATLEEHEIPFDPTNYFQGDYSMKSGMRVGSILAARGDLPEIVVCANDNMAQGVVQALDNAGICVPGDIAVSGFDGDPLQGIDPGFLTTCIIPRYEMGYLAAETLVAMITQQAQSVTRPIKAALFRGASTPRKK